MNDVTFFEPTAGGRNVVEKFLRKELKRLPDTQDALVRHLRFLELTPIATLREQGRLEHVKGTLLSYRFETKDHWVRLLATLWSTDHDIVILLPVLKKRNRLDVDDIRQAERNLHELHRRTTE